MQNHVICKFYLSLSNLDSFYFLSCLIVLARTSSTLNISDKNGHPCLVPDLREKAFSFFIVEYYVSCGLFISGFYSVEVNFFYT